MCATSAMAPKTRVPSIRCLCSASDSLMVRPVGQTLFGSSKLSIADFSLVTATTDFVPEPTSVGLPSGGSRRCRYFSEVEEEMSGYVDISDCLLAFTPSESCQLGNGKSLRVRRIVFSVAAERLEILKSTLQKMLIWLPKRGWLKSVCGPLRTSTVVGDPSASVDLGHCRNAPPICARRHWVGDMPFHR